MSIIAELLCSDDFVGGKMFWLQDDRKTFLFYRYLLVSCSFNRVILFQACDSSPCLNGGTCFEDKSGEEYICKCTNGWKGDNCGEEKFAGTQETLLIIQLWFVRKASDHHI